MQKILTVPVPMVEEGVVYATGNHYVSLPEIGADGAVYALSHLLEKTNSLLEYRGTPLLRLLVNGQRPKPGAACYEADFLPHFAASEAALDVTWRWLAPQGIRGVVLRADVVAKEDTAAELSLAFTAGVCNRCIFHSYPVDVAEHFRHDEWTRSLVLELVAGTPLSALALSGGEGSVLHPCEEGARGMRVSRSLTLKTGETATAEFYVSVGAEADGARLANLDMQRRAGLLYSGTLAALAATPIPVTDPVLRHRAALNLHFCYNFSIGYALDTGRLMLATSKSSRYYVSGAYWARDCMLWAFPAIVRKSPPMAREVLLAACTTYLREGGNHAVYLNGAPLYPGFELDELVSPFIALGRYLQKTGDEALCRELALQKAAAFTLAALQQWHDADAGLYRTELNPSDDPVGMPYLIYDNHLVLAALRVINGRFDDVSREIRALEAALEQHSTAGDTSGGRVLVWACDGRGGYELYDDPPGSLLLLPYYGGITADNPVYKATVARYFSPQNPYYAEAGALRGQGCEHAQAPWPMSVCNLLLANGADETLLQSLRVMEMDNGIACETVDADTGKLCTGAAFATFAGFYANALCEAYED